MASAAARNTLEIEENAQEWISSTMQETTNSKANSG
jgi:hypothetical protein